MGRNNFREDALKYWDIKCEDAWIRFEYLTDVINRVASMGPKATADTCRDLLPDRWKRSAGAGIFQKR